MKRILLCFSLIFTITHLFESAAIAQNPSKVDLYKITQASPNAASLGKYGEYPVGLYTGTPNIDIPLYEINAGRIKMPISLSYHTGGIKVEEIASSVGLGWSLNAGGVITRTVMGLPDDNYYVGDTQNFFTASLTVDALLARIDDPNYPPLDNYNYLKKIIAGKIDGEPDVFYFNFGTMSGKFMYHQTDHKFYSIPYSTLKIEFAGQPGNSSFTLTDDKGIQYSFNDQEISHRESNDVSNPDVPVTTSWFLSSIYDPVSKQSMTFGYEDYTLAYSTLGYEAYYFTPFKNDVHVNPKQDIFHYLKRLKSINFNLGQVVFDYQMPRCDLPGDYALSSIKVYNDHAQLVKNFALSYDYFLTTSFQPSPGDCNIEQEAVNKRLRLLTVEEKAPEAINTQSKPYTFEYSDRNLPSRWSKAQDYWGFYNGEDGNQHLYTDYVVSTSPLVIVQGGNRQVDPNACQAGSIKKITYPTGGHTDFEFESNTSPNPDLPVLEQHNATFGGVDDTKYGESYFTVNSLPTLQNNFQAGAYMTLTVSGLEPELLQVLYRGLAITVSYVNVDTGVGDILFMYGGNKEVGQLGLPGTFYLPNGNYKLITDCTENPVPESWESASAYLTWTTYQNNTNFNRYVGGLRVKRIVNYKDASNIATVRSYQYGTEENPLVSSGETQFHPVYSDQVMFSPNDQGDLDIPIWTKLHSSSNYPLVAENGKSIGYSNVIELNGDDDSNGYTQHKYTNFDQYPDSYAGGYTTALPISYQWLRGQELSRKVFKRVGTQNKLLSETINEYDTELLGAGKKTFNGVRGIFIFASSGVPLELPGEDMLFIGEAAPGWDNHPTYADFVYLKKSTERSYDDNNNFVENVKSYTYNTRNLLPSITETTNSVGEKLITHTNYPLDYNVNGATHPKAVGVKNLQDLNYISPAIEQYTEKQTGTGNKRLVGGIYNSYLPDQPLIDTVFYQSIPRSGVNNYSGISLTANSFVKSSIYDPELIVEKYDPYSNLLLQQKKDHGPSHSYFWDYQSTFPVAEAAGAAYDEIAYTSFEAESKGNWAFNGTIVTDATAPSGKKVYNLSPSNPITKNDLNINTQYTLTYWAKGTGGDIVSGTAAASVLSRDGWTQYTRMVTGAGSIIITGTVLIDDVRLCPVTAQMTTWTFDPLVGMTSSTDAKGQTTYYEYDGLQRLVNIKDQNGKILKHTDYHYITQ